MLPLRRGAAFTPISKARKITGVVNRVRTCDRIRPPRWTGQRLAQFMPHAAPKIIGTAAKSAAKVVIMIGRKQMRGALDRFFGGHAFFAHGRDGKVDHHDRVLFHNADQQHDADNADHWP
jgi:hypothetical protein